MDTPTRIMVDGREWTFREGLLSTPHWGDSIDVTEISCSEDGDMENIIARITEQLVNHFECRDHEASRLCDWLFGPNNHQRLRAHTCTTTDK